MTPTLEDLESAAMMLQPSDRARPVERLILGLDQDPGVDAAWAEEVERRHAEIGAGTVTVFAGPETLAKLRSALRRPVGFTW